MNDTPLSLLDRLRSDPDERSWRQLAELYSPLVLRRLRQQGIAEADAEDLLQEILLVIIREVPHFDHTGRPGAFRGWMRAIITHRLLAYWRSQRQGASRFLPDVLEQLEDPESDLSRRWDLEHDRYLASRLLELIEPEFTPATWRAFRLQVIDGLPASAVAEQLGQTVNAVLIAKSRVLRRLRQEGRGLIG
ncbi:RNA polymerase sigma factor [Tautonia sociabilis]|uniref:Sigma-70 family RNA polymerase sigma factor n=1 Tax=Tautonia sociabilis TaxID=2080755 RepID=A0A432MCJ1_9BACT|nr:sigma-70 family RNA polymerase sigma factor [Tautonia sociabilis]RUL81811.1 sigma-70 family RNA polymerase sigma factor [Tautonia sociabilis]